MAARVLEKLRAVFKGRDNRHASKIRRKRAISELCWKSWPTLRYINSMRVIQICLTGYIFRLLLVVVGYLWLLTIPSTLHGQKTYIDENALQPSQVR
jgi:GPI-anchor transamidase subunit GAA1